MLQTRIAFHVSDDTSGRVVLFRAGAENLPALPGRAIVKLDGYHLLQTYYLDKARLVELVERQPRVAAVASWNALAGDDLLEDEDDALAERAREMYARGVSKTRIAQKVYGGTGGSSWYKMEQALTG